MMQNRQSAQRTLAFRIGSAQDGADLLETGTACAIAYNYAADAGLGSQTFSHSDTWRRALLGTVAASALFFGYGRRAYADCVGAGTTLTCTGDLTGTGVANGGIDVPNAYGTLNVDNLNADITPNSGTDGIEFTRGGDVTVFSGDTTPVNISATGAGADGIYAGSIQTVVVRSTGNVSSANGIGIRTSTTVDPITITSTGNVTGATAGIYANSTSGDGDQVTINSTGDVTATAGIGIHVTGPGRIPIEIVSTGNVTATSSGIDAESGSLSAGAGTVMVTSIGQITAGFRGIRAVSQVGDITVASTGDVSATSTSLFAESNSGSISITSAGTLTSSGSGIFALTQTGGVTIDSTGDVTGTNSLGIYAYSRSTGVVMVTSRGNVTSSREGIFSRSIGGNVTVNSTGNVTSSSNEGIEARSSGAGVVSVTSTGNVTGRQSGISAYSGTGAVTVNSTGNVTSTGGGGFTGYGIIADSNTGTVTITSNGDVTSSTRDAIQGDSNSGNITITLNGGTVYGARYGVNFENGATNALNNAAVVSGGTNAVMGSGGNETVNNTGSITGNVSLGGGTNAFNNNAGGTFNSGATVNLGAGNALTNAGNLSPGNTGTVQTTALTGNIVQTGTGTFTVDIAGATADRVNATGTAGLAGTVVVNVASTPTAAQFTILSATGGTTNNGLGLSTSPALSGSSLSYPNANDVVLNVSVNFAIDGLNRNERALAAYLNAAFAAGVGGLDPLLTALLNTQGLAAYKNALDQLLPSLYSDAQIAALYSSLGFSDSLLSCKVNGTDTASIIREGQCLWAGASATFLDTGTTFSQLGFSGTTGSFAAGAQVALDHVWRFGFGAGYQKTTLTSATNATSDGQQGQVGATLKYNPGAFLAAAAISGGRGWYDTTRPVAFTGFSGTATSDSQIGIFNGAVRLAQVFGSPHLYFKPVLDAAATRLDLSGFTETGGGAANLSVRGSDQTVYTIAPSLEVGTEWWWPNGTLVRPFVRGGATWYENGDLALSASFVGAPAGITPFTILTGIDEVMGVVGAGLDVITDDDTVLNVTYDGQLGQTTQIHSVALKGSARF